MWTYSPIQTHFLLCSYFDPPNGILIYAGASPSTYQFGKLESSYSHMEKQEFRYLCFALINTAKYVCHWGRNFRRLFSEEDFRKEALQCCRHSHSEKTCTVDICNRKIRKGTYKKLHSFFCLITHSLSTAIRVPLCYIILKIQLYLKRISAIHSNIFISILIFW